MIAIVRKFKFKSFWYNPMEKQTEFICKLSDYAKNNITGKFDEDSTLNPSEFIRARLLPEDQNVKNLSKDVHEMVFKVEIDEYILSIKGVEILNAINLPGSDDLMLSFNKKDLSKLKKALTLFWDDDSRKISNLPSRYKNFDGSLKNTIVSQRTKKPGKRVVDKVIKGHKGKAEKLQDRKEALRARVK